MGRGNRLDALEWLDGAIQPNTANTRTRDTRDCNTAGIPSPSSEYPLPVTNASQPGDQCSDQPVMLTKGYFLKIQTCISMCTTMQEYCRNGHVSYLLPEGTGAKMAVQG